MSYLVSSNPRDLRYSSVSFRLNGRRNMRVADLLNRPPLSPSSLSVIHEVALPQATRTMLSSADAQPFQNDSNAETKSESAVSSHGISSMKTTLLSDLTVRR